MNNNKKESLINISEGSIFYKIKNFFWNLVNKKIETSNEEDIIKENEERKNFFIESIKSIETEETKIQKLQQQYRSGAIKEEDMTEQQISDLCKLYDKQIESLKKSNEEKKNRILEYKKKLQAST